MNGRVSQSALALLRQDALPDFGAAVDITAMSAAQLGAMLDSGAITSREIVLQYMYRIQQYDHAGPALRAVAQINPDILKIADAADAQRAAAKAAGLTLSPLFGVPALVKLNIGTDDGLATNAGSVALIGSRPAADATVIAGLRDYGVIILGKANMGEWAGFVSNDHSSVGGQMLNPYDPTVTLAGSSGGSSIAINMHFAPLTIGTQTSDSILYPAQQQGIYALKPTEGLVSTTGIAPYSAAIDVAGPMANSVRDLALMLNGMVKQDQTDTRAAAHVRPADYSAGLTGDLTGVTVGVYNATPAEAPHRSPLFASTVTTMLEAARATVVQLDRARVDAAVKTAVTALSDDDLAVFATGAGSNVPTDPAGRAAFLADYRATFSEGAEALVRVAGSAPIFDDAAHSIAAYLAQRVSSPQDYQSAFVRLFGDRFTRLDANDPTAYVKTLADLVRFAELNPDLGQENLFRYLQNLANGSSSGDISALYQRLIKVTTSVMAGTRAALGIDAALGTIGDDDNENDGHIAFTFMTDQLSGSPELAVPVRIDGAATSLVINANPYQEATLLKIGDALQKQLATPDFAQHQVTPPDPPASGFVVQPIDQGPLLPLVLNDLDDHGRAVPAHLLSTAMAPLTLNATGSLADAVFDGTISGSGGLIKEGAGLQSLTGTSDFTGAVDVWSGTLAIASTAALGDAANTVILEDGSALVATRSLALGRAVLLKNGGALGAQAGVSFVEDGIVSGTGGLTKTGAGRLTLGAPGSYDGGTFLDGGTLELGRIDAAGTGAITFGAGAQTLELDTAGPLANRIAGFGPGDTIGLTTLSGTLARMSYAGDSLSVTDGTRTTSFAIAAPAIGYSFALGTDANGGAALRLAPAWVNGQITITAANRNDLGDIVFTSASETLFVDSAALQDEVAQDGSAFARLPNHLVDFGYGDKIVILGTSLGGTSWNFEPASGRLNVHQVVSGNTVPDKVLTFDNPAASVFGTGIFSYDDDGVAIRLSAPPPGDPADGLVGDVAATRLDPTGWAAKAASWESPEFLANWGGGSVKAHYAYALGITGAGVKVGMVDSGLYKGHQEFKDNPNIVPVDTRGVYTSSGKRYESGDTRLPNSGYAAGEAFDLPGRFDPTFNDFHGTTIGGVVAAARNGTGMHGIAFGATFYAANSGGTDGIEYGANTDYGYYEAAYGAVAASGARAINTSWGGPDSQDDYNTLAGATAAYARSYGHPTHLDALADVALNADIIHVFAGGNLGHNNLNINSSLAYFRPALEKHWISVNGYDEVGNQMYNKAGIEKYWAIAAPGQDITTTVVGGPEGLSVNADPTDPNPYINWGNGTSDAAPHVTGALALVMQRFAYLGNDGARDVLLTTATHHDAVAGTPDAHPDAPNALWGWGWVDIKTAMDGPGQFLGAFTVDMGAGVRDVWLNPIGEGALIQRQEEDAAEQAGWQATLGARGWDAAPPTAQSSVDDQVAYATGTARAAAAAARVYQGSLIKDGAGALTLGGAHGTYSGGTFLNGGTLELDAIDAAGIGTIRFGAGAQTLVLDDDAFRLGTFANTIDDFGATDTIGLSDLAYSATATATYDATAQVLTVASGGLTHRLTLTDIGEGAFTLTGDGSGGTRIALTTTTPPVVPPEPPEPPQAIPGTDGNDLLLGNDRDNTIVGGHGSDTVHAGAGGDLVYGGDGPADPQDAGDILYGDAGADTLYGNGGDDVIYGGQAAGDPSDAGDTVFAGLGNDIVFGNGGDDLLYGNAGSDTVYGGVGSDTICGGDGLADPADAADVLYGGEGDDFIFANGGDDIVYGGRGLADPSDGADLVHGGLGNDIVYGNGGGDRLFGDEGNDALFGGAGDDVLTGGTGADRFYFALNDGRDTVTDFDAGAGDRLLLQGQTYTATGTDAGVELALSGGGFAVLEGVTLEAFHAGQGSFFA